MSYERILVPVDGSATSTAGLKHALSLAKAGGSRIRLIHVIDEAPLVSYPEAVYQVGDWIEDLTRAGQEILQKACRMIEAAGVRCESTLVESKGLRVSDVITQEAKRWRASVIVIGTHGRRGVNRLLMGSDAELVVRNTSVPVLLVHGVHEPARRPARRSAASSKPGVRAAARV
jgi:nucleotide-binding universal stress UspA family protein